MKKLTILGVLFVLLFASCKKNRSCQCVYTDGDVETSIIVNETKKGAKNICNAKSTSSKSCSLN